MSVAGKAVKFKVDITDSSRSWFTRQLNRMNMGARSMGNTILADSRMIAPKSADGGRLRDEAKVVYRQNSVIVVYPGPYAGVQERGGRFDGTYIIKHYTTPNTGKNFLQSTGERVAGKGIKWYLSHS